MHGKAANQSPNFWMRFFLSSSSIGFLVVPVYFFKAGNLKDIENINANQILD